MASKQPGTLSFGRDASSGMTSIVGQFCVVEAQGDGGRGEAGDKFVAELLEYIVH